MKWINILLVFGFGILAILLALICLYASPTEDTIYPLASAIFVVSGMISFSSIFLIGKFVVEISLNSVVKHIKEFFEKTSALYFWINWHATFCFSVRIDIF